MTAEFYLQIGVSLTALGSAVFWLRSARASAPLMTWAGIGDLPAFLRRVIRYNLIAAIFAGASGILTGIATILPFTRWLLGAFAT
jgi:hypothetical protein